MAEIHDLAVNGRSIGAAMSTKMPMADWDDVLLMGQQSGGGACVVGYISTALGSIMQISSEQMLVTMKNGYIRDIDGGLTPDVHLTVKNLFNRDYIVNLLNEQFA